MENKRTTISEINRQSYSCWNESNFDNCMLWWERKSLHRAYLSFLRSIVRIEHKEVQQRYARFLGHGAWWISRYWTIRKHLLSTLFVDYLIEKKGNFGNNSLFILSQLLPFTQTIAQIVHSPSHGLHRVSVERRYDWLAYFIGKFTFFNIRYPWIITSVTSQFVTELSCKFQQVRCTYLKA